MDGQQSSSSESLEKTTCDLPGEIWKDIEGYEGIYQVSNMGRVRSLTRKVWNYTKPGRILSPGAKENGYLHVALNNGEKREKHAHIHRLVAAAFIPNPDNLPEVNHKNYDKKDNRVENLEWCTSRYNKAHFRKSPYAKNADKKKSRTLANKSIQYILTYKDEVCRIYDLGYSIKEVASIVGIGKDMARDILVIYGRLK